jgi:transketolase
VFTAEDHFVNGGLGSAVCEVLAETCPTPVCRIGVKDTFGRSGTFDSLLEHYGMSAACMAETIKQALR